MPGPIIIVGGGLAGLFCALKLAPLPVTVLAAAPIGEGASSAWAQGGIAAAMSDGDTPEQHTADTVVAGAGTVDEAVVLGMAREAGDRIRDLLSYGVPFDRDLEGRLVQSREAAHSARRIVRVRGDMAGKAIMEALVAAVRRTPSITVVEGEVAEGLVVEAGRVVGVDTRGDGGMARVVRRWQAADVVLATGGIGHLYAVTTNPVQANGNGLAIGAMAGAVVADAEFVQFHPTAIAIGRDPAPLATEALRGDGATLVDGSGARFMLPIHPDAELAPRDIVARGVFASIQAGKGAFLDCRQAIGAEFPDRFPTVYATCRSAGIDPVTQPIPVAPAEHYHMGGLLTDATGRTTVASLWAAGEVASTGVHGANRLASNSLLEAVVFAARIAAALKGTGRKPKQAQSSVLPGCETESTADPASVAALRRVMTEQVGVIRDGAGLSGACEWLASCEADAGSTALRNMAITARFIAASALTRCESRGGHYRADFPQADLAQARRSRLRRDQLAAVLQHPAA